VITRRRGELVGTVALLTGHQLGEMAVPVVLGLAIDDALANASFSHLLLWIAVLAVDFLTLSLSWRFGSRLGAKVRFEIAHDLRVLVVGRVLDGRGIAERGEARDEDDGPAEGDARAGAGGRRGWATGETLTVAVSDARRVGDAVRMALAAVAYGIVLLATLVAVAVISPLLAVVVILGGVVTLVAIALLSRPVEARSHAEQEANGRAASLTVDLVAGLRVLAGLRAGAAAAARYRAVSGGAVRSSIRAAEAEAAVTGIAALAVGVYLAAVAAVSAELALDGHISIAAVIAVLGLSQLLLGPLQGIAQAVPSVRRGRASASRVEGLLAAPTALVGTDEATIPSDGHLSVEGLRGRGLDGVDLTVRAGSLHGVVSESPLSAESLVRALAGESEVDGGRVLVGEVDLSEATPTARREAVLAWLHKGVPPGDSLTEIVGSEATEALDAAGASEIVKRIPGGWDAPIAERAATLSGGERQRLALARVLAERPPVLVMHEPTSAVDAVTELAIAAGIARQRRGLTTVLVTTSPTLLAACDEVSLILDGRVAASAPHGDLLERDGYREVVGR
jgi:putative ABC transport system ATP-binding protein